MPALGNDAAVVGDYFFFLAISTPLPFFLAFSAARRWSSLGMSFLLVGLTKTRPPLGPGMAPRTSSRLLSLSILTTSRLRTVIWTLPYWPAMWMPFLGRPLPRLEAFEAVLPGWRWTFLVPCAAGMP